MKILIFGNSVGLNVRPNTDSKWTYVRFLERKYPYKEGHLVINKCKWNLMITDETLETFANEVLQNRPDYIIFNFGINESAPRTIPKFLWRILNNQDGRQSNMKVLINKVIKYFSPSLIKRFNLKGWVKEELFLHQLKARLEFINKETHSQTIVLGITKANERVERLLPNINDIIISFNKGMAQLCSKMDECYFIDVFDLGDETGDGIHYTEKGHKMVFERILYCINEVKICAE